MAKRKRKPSIERLYDQLWKQGWKWNPETQQWERTEAQAAVREGVGL